MPQPQLLRSNPARPPLPQSRVRKGLSAWLLGVHPRVPLRWKRLSACFVGLWYVIVRWNVRRFQTALSRRQLMKMI
jgi:antibiotic biosynthesis monooxygenase (ABM) superfamily enzyme